MVVSLGEEEEDDEDEGDKAAEEDDVESYRLIIIRKDMIKDT